MEQVFATLAALVETILPSEDGAGGAESDAARFVARALEADARLASGVPFDDLSPPQRTLVLKRPLSTEPAPPERAMRLPIALSLDGFLRHPHRGGNRDGSGWAWLGFRPRP